MWHPPGLPPFTVPPHAPPLASPDLLQVPQVSIASLAQSAVKVVRYSGLVHTVSLTSLVTWGKLFHVHGLSVFTCKWESYEY